MGTPVACAASKTRLRSLRRSSPCSTGLQSWNTRYVNCDTRNRTDAEPRPACYRREARLSMRPDDHAIFSIEDNGETWVPFSLTEDVAGKRTLTRYVADRVEVMLAQ